MKILTIIAHPDDETMLTGGALALLAQAGAEVHYLCATRGERGEPPLCSRPELGALREQEMCCAVQALGGEGVEFLDYVDPTVGEDDVLYPYTEDFDELVNHLVEHMVQLEPQVVITHGVNGEYGHPAHQLTHRATRQAVERINAMPPSTQAGILLYTFSAFFERHPRPRLANADAPAHIVLDISPVFKQKVTAALCHKTQHALFVRRTSKRLGRQVTVPEVIQTVEGLHRVYPMVEGVVDDALRLLLRPWVKH